MNYSIDNTNKDRESSQLNEEHLTNQQWLQKKIMDDLIEGKITPTKAIDIETYFESFKDQDQTY